MIKTFAEAGRKQSGGSRSAPGIEIKTPAEIEKMRRVGRVVAEVLHALAAAAKPGISTGDLDRLAAEEIKKREAIPAFLNYRGYPAVLCASVNDEVIHGIPDDSRVLREGDLISLDLGAVAEGYYGDSALTVPVGSVNPEAQRLMDVTSKSLEKALAAIKPGATVGDVSSAVESCVTAGGMSVIREFVGHGIGRNLHEEPAVPNYGRKGTGPRLEPGMVLAVEPMVCLGSSGDVVITENRWTAVTKDGSLSAHFEHTVAVTEHGREVLTDIRAA
ncbi:MAG: type I methionyl aminopeptidase [bacterium]